MIAGYTSRLGGSGCHVSMCMGCAWSMDVACGGSKEWA